MESGANVIMLVEALTWIGAILCAVGYLCLLVALLRHGALQWRCMAGAGYGARIGAASELSRDIEQVPSPAHPSPSFAPIVMPFSGPPHAMNPAEVSESHRNARAKTS